MAHMAVQLLGYILSITGLCGLIYATVTNEWKVIGHENGKAALVGKREGLWMECSMHGSSMEFTCVSFSSITFQSVEIQVGRAMMIISIGLASVGVVVAVAGLKCTRCLDGDDGLKVKVALTGGILFILSGLCALILTSWSIYKIISDFYATESKERYVVGSSLIAGVVAALLCLSGGIFLSICSATCMQSSSNVVKHPTSKNSGKVYV